MFYQRYLSLLISITGNKGQKYLNLELPILERKWSRINLDKLSKKEKSNLYRIKCFELFNNGLSVNQVIQESGFSRSTVYKQYNTYQTIKNRDIDREIRNFV